MEPRPIDVLLAEDNDDDVVMIREAFARARLVNFLHVAPDGDDVLRYLRREGEYANARQPELLLLDINMPGKTGFETLEEIKADPELASLPVVMLTTSRREEDIARSYAEGACSVVTKPASFGHFVKLAQEFAIYWAMVASLPGRAAMPLGE